MSNKSDFPRTESIEFFEKAIIEHHLVESLGKISDCHYCLKLSDDREYKIYLTNIYTIGIADIVDITSDYDINAIVTISNWNSYTLEAKEYGQSIGIGVFLFGELMGAINFEKPEKYYTEIVDGKKVYKGARN